MKKLKRVYKVVKQSWGDLISSDSSNSLRYRIGEITKGQIGPIFTFSNFEDADSYSRWGTVILECRPVGTVKRYRKVLSSASMFKEEFWKLKKQKKGIPKDLITYSPPKGTVFCDAVEVLKKVNLR